VAAVRWKIQNERRSWNARAIGAKTAREKLMFWETGPTT
jgi:hypothetical protein